MSKQRYFSGCTYSVNTGKSQFEPFGTALSTHECGSCERLQYCKVKKRTALWEHNKEIASRMEADLLATMGMEQEDFSADEAAAPSDESKSSQTVLDRLSMEDALNAAMGIGQDQLAEDGHVSEENKRFSYMMLGRLKSDCDYYLGAGMRDSDRLWAKSEVAHISHMRHLWNSFSEAEKPEWLTWDQIIGYERKMIPMQKPAYADESFYFRVHVFERPEGDDDFVKVTVSNGETLQDVNFAIHIMADDILYCTDLDVDDRLDAFIKAVEEKHGWKLSYCSMMEALEIV